jgi:hypothetical protein
MDPLLITVCKADATILPVQPAVLSIAGDLPRVAGTDESEWRPNTLALFRDEAQRIMRALKSLPQGTLDQLLMLLLEGRASLLRVPVLTDDKETDHD